MRQTDVYAVELTQYRGGGDRDLRVLVPRIHGEVATSAESPSGRRTVQRTTRAETDAAIQSRPGPEVRRIATTLLDHAAADGRPEGGTAKYPSDRVRCGRTRTPAVPASLSGPVPGTCSSAPSDSSLLRVCPRSRSGADLCPPTGVPSRTTPG
jgi:hypothetical protein